MIRIVTDSGADLNLSPEQRAALGIKVVPLVVTLDGASYREDMDITPDAFYSLLENTHALPTTSQPALGDFVTVYRQAAAADEQVLSIHISSGLSGTYNAAVLAAQQVPEARVTHVDAKTLSASVGWQVEAAARAAQAGWPMTGILELVQRISDATESVYTLKELKYLIHGGRISHMKGLLASMLNIKPLIGVEKEGGTYVQLGQVRTFKRAVQGLVDLMTEQHAPGSKLRVQVLHSWNPEGAAMLRELISQQFDCAWSPVGPMSLVLGAHTGPSMIGVAYAPLAVFADVP